MEEAEVSVKTEPSQECDSEVLKEEPEIAKEKDSVSDDRAGANTDLTVGKTEDGEPEDRDRAVKGRTDQLRAVFVGNFPPMFTADDIEGLFVKHGEVRRVDKKQNFAFVFMNKTDDAEFAIRELGGKSIGRPPRTLRVEWSRGDGAVRRREVARRSRSLPPNETLFVVNYDPESVVQKDLEDLFKVHGNIVRIELHGQFTFVQYETIDMAAKALESLNGFNFKNRNLIVEFSNSKDSSGGGRGRYPNQRMNDHGPRGYERRAPYNSQYPPMGNMGGYSGHGPGNYGGGYRGNHGPPPYSMNQYHNSHGYRGNGGYGRFDDRGRYADSRQSVPRPSGRRDDGYGWSAALSDSRNKRSHSPRSMSPRRGHMGLSARKERGGRSRSRSRSASPGRSRGRNRRSMSRSVSPKKRRSDSLDAKGGGRGRSRSRSRSPVARSHSRSISRSRSLSASPSRIRGTKGSPGPRGNSPNHDRRKRSRSRSPLNGIADSPQKRAKLGAQPSAVSSSP